jgi:hypothetical protein
MEFRRSGQGGERRRKVLLEESSSDLSAARDAAAQPNKASKSDAIAKAYALAAVEVSETRVADLLPTRVYGICVLLLCGLTAIAGVELLYTFLPDWLAKFGAAGASALDVSARGSLCGWLSSVLLGMCAVLAVMVYIIRRHKMDDYRGRYRLWLWAAAGLMLASIDAIAGLRGIVDVVAVYFSRMRLVNQPTGWSMTAIALFGGLLGVRVLIDLWRSRAATAMLLLAGLGYAGAAALIAFPPRLTPMLAAISLSVSVLVSHLVLCGALMLYARHVLLEARGLISVKKKEKAKPKAKKATRETKDGKKIKIDAAHSQPATKMKTTDVDAKPAAAAASSSPASSKPGASVSVATTTSPPAAKSGPLSGLLGKKADYAPKASSGTATATKGAEKDHDEHGPLEGTARWHALPKHERKRLVKLRRKAMVEDDE